MVLVCKVKTVGGSLADLTYSKILAISNSDSVSGLPLGEARVHLTFHKPLLSASGGVFAFRQPGGLHPSGLKEDSSNDTVSGNQEEWVSVPFFNLFPLSRCEQS